MNNEKELDMNDLIRDFNEYSTDYNKTTCEYYRDYLRNYQKEKLELQQRIDKAIEYIENNTYSSVATMKTILHLQNDELYDLLEILKGDKE